MRLIAFAIGLLLSSNTAVMAQAIAGSSRGGDAAVNYEWIHSNTQPGQCGCFGLTGAGFSFSRNITNRTAVVADLSASSAKNGPGTGNSLTLVSYMAGGRYYVSQPWFHGPHAVEPYGQVLVGVAHAGGGIAGAGDHTYALAGRAGAGFDIPFGNYLAVRVLQVDYFLTDFANASNGHQNNYLIGAGAVIRWNRSY